MSRIRYNILNFREYWNVTKIKNKILSVQKWSILSKTQSLAAVRHMQ